MGTDESDSMVLGSEQEKEVREVLGGLRSEEGSCGVTVNGDGFSSIESEGLCCDGVRVRFLILELGFSYEHFRVMTNV